jgi:hypothetical protein
MDIRCIIGQSLGYKVNTMAWHLITVQLVLQPQQPNHSHLTPMHFPNSTPDQALPDNQHIGSGIADTISCIPNSAARSRVQHAAYLLGVC